MAKWKKEFENSIITAKIEGVGKTVIDTSIESADYWKQFAIFSDYITDISGDETQEQKIKPKPKSKKK